jgi:hypothetical protein
LYRKGGRYTGGFSGCDFIDGSKGDSSRLEENVASRCDSSKAGGGIEGFGCVHAVARFLAGALGYNCCKAFLLDFDLPQLASLKRLYFWVTRGIGQKGREWSFWIHAEQYFQVIPNVKSKGMVGLQVQACLGY